MYVHKLISIEKWTKLGHVTKKTEAFALDNVNVQFSQQVRLNYFTHNTKNCVHFF